MGFDFGPPCKTKKTDDENDNQLVNTDDTDNTLKITENIPNPVTFKHSLLPAVPEPQKLEPDSLKKYKKVAYFYKQKLEVENQPKLEVCDEEPLFYLTQTSNNEKSSDLLSLTPNIYEGGGVVWECTFDLINFLNKVDNFSKFCSNATSILELGCGQSLPSIFLIKNCKKVEKVHLQDYNLTVLEDLTKNVLNLNLQLENHSKLDITLTSSDWSKFNVNCNLPNINSTHEQSQSQTSKFDLILASECTYSETNYDKFHKLLERSSNENTKILIAMKSHYFGPGGSVSSWEKFVKSRQKFSIERVLCIKDNLPKFILLMVKNKKFEN